MKHEARKIYEQIMNRADAKHSVLVLRNAKKRLEDDQPAGPIEQDSPDVGALGTNTNVPAAADAR